MTGPALFDVVPSAAVGPMRRLLAARIGELTGAGHAIAADLAELALSLADRIDRANAGGDRRGFVMLSAEYRSARRDLFEGLDDANGDDGFEAALSAFRAATPDHAGDAGPTD